MEILKVENLGIEMASKTLYQNVNFSIKGGEILAVVGDNGVGKTTLIRALMKKQKISNGNFKWNVDLKNDVSYVPQYRSNIESFPINIKSFVELSFNSGLIPWLSKNEKTKLSKILQVTNLQDIQQQRIDKASGGEKQRAYLAQAMINDPKILILDEATANLDNIAKYQLMDLVKKLSKEKNLSVIMVSHDLKIVEKYADKYLLLANNSSEFADIKRLDTAKLDIGEDHHA